jgi:uncharacterized membrane protein
VGEYLADKLASGMGSWTFLTIQSTILLAWVLFNIFSIYEFDPYPFVFLNLLLSFQAAYAAPIIMMSSNRKEQMDRNRSINIYNLEKAQMKNLAAMLIHLDNHFEKVNARLDQLESKISDQPAP